MKRKVCVCACVSDRVVQVVLNNGSHERMVLSMCVGG